MYIPLGIGALVSFNDEHTCIGTFTDRCIGIVLDGMHHSITVRWVQRCNAHKDNKRTQAVTKEEVEGIGHL